MRNPNPARTSALQGTKLAEWDRLSQESLAALIVSPERAAEIMRLYPEDEMSGRPGRFAPSNQKLRSTRGKIRKVDGGEEPDEVAEQDEMELVAAE